ncbi:Tubulin-tyrosine ligase/Tubulin polyglutamylase [Carpediemonas membranifera]|uniref:Tubulin-tyrosine ligase/Tubulin polyglutamylase n=1 Tax=Carpediemonas membranifera TaxID=201153 RepID=A0A8J6E7J2_9EUKA|nr:Tubulin-tyrosine ligase/Tubulin polyglutamylase [Carpediemonas membranifera]|eukprot:KAG9390775.1 Tubulin-tyrosine ligase/Tubulin polyglutamylase [Carpediemonas membranifera]
MEGMMAITASQINLKTRPVTPRQPPLQKLPSIPHLKTKPPKAKKQKALDDFKLPTGQITMSGSMNFRSMSVPRPRDPKPLRPSKPRRLSEQNSRDSGRSLSTGRRRGNSIPENPARPRVSHVPIKVRWTGTDALAISGSVVEGNEGVVWYERDASKSDDEVVTTRAVQLFDFASCKSRVDAPALAKKRERFLKFNRLDPNTKLFTLIGPYGDIKDELLARGWVENPEGKETLVTDLLLTVRSNGVAAEDLPTGVYHNHYGGAAALTTKVGLGKHIRDLMWISPTDYRSFFPVAFDLGNTDDLDCFKRHHAVFGALSVLETALQKSVPQDMFDLAHRAVKECICEYNHDYLQNEAEATPHLTDKEWSLLSAFLGRTVPKAPPTLTTAQVSATMDLLAAYRGMDPSSILTSGLNLWICKPAGKSRGRGIQCMDALPDIMGLTGQEAHYVVQKYIERPLLIHNRKFDCRVWCLVTSVSPFTVWVYDDYYLRFCCEDFSMDDLANTYVHLANNSVQKNSTNFDNIVPPDAEHLCPTDGRPLKKTERANNMWASASFAEYIAREHGEEVYVTMMEDMRRAIVNTLVVGQTAVRHRKHTYELFGVDVVFDTELKPWVLEVNSSPTLEHSSYVTARLVPEAMKGLVAVLLDTKDSKIKASKSGWASGGAGRGAGEGGVPETVGRWRLVYKARHAGKVADGGGLELAGVAIPPPRAVPNSARV